MRSLDAVRPLLLGEVTWEGRVGQIFAFAVDHPDGLVLVDTGMIDTHPAIEEEFRPVVHPWPELGEVVAVVNTHLHFDHCGGNRLFPGVPIYVQRRELEAVAEPGYLVEWVWFDGADYVPVDGDADLMPGISVVLVPGHSPGQQAVVVETDEGRVVLAGDVTYRLRDFDESGDENIGRILALGPRRIWISHAARPWEPAVQ